MRSEPRRSVVFSLHLGFDAGSLGELQMSSRPQGSLPPPALTALDAFAAHRGLMPRGQM